MDKIGGLLTFGRTAILGGGHGSGKSTFVTEVAKENSKTKNFTVRIPISLDEYLGLKRQLSSGKKREQSVLDAEGNVPIVVRSYEDEGEEVSS